jgi:hypothetical protein
MRYGLILGLILLAVVGRLIPHPDNSLVGDLFWTALLFGLYEVGYSWLKSPRAKPTHLTP